jgi:hypothetical protein
VQIDGYIRVSRIAGRSGESFISPDEQRRAIEAYAAAHKLEIVEWHTDLDQSGGTLDRPAFQAALDRCRRGETGGISDGVSAARSVTSMDFRCLVKWDNGSSSSLRVDKGELRGIRRM